MCESLQFLTQFSNRFPQQQLGPLYCSLLPLLLGQVQLLLGAEWDWTGRAYLPQGEKLRGLAGGAGNGLSSLGVRAHPG